MDGGQSGASSPQTATPARAAVDVIAITVRDDFLLELGATLGGQASINPVDSATFALEQLSSARRPQVLMIDSRDVSDIRADVEAVQSQAPRASIVVFAAEGADQQLADILRGTSVFAVLPLPVDQTKTSAIFGGAVAEARNKQADQNAPAPEARSAPLIQPALTETPSVEARATEPPSAGGGRSFKMQVALGGIAAIILVGGLIAYFTKDKAPAPAIPVAEQPADAAAIAETTLPAVETSLVKGKVDELLEKARLAMRERRYAEPAGDNALLYYRSAAATDATSAEALDGLNRVAGVLAGRFEEALQGAKLEDAATALAQFKNAMPEDARITALQQRLTGAQVSKAMADGNLDRAAALVRAAQQGNLMPTAQIARWRSEISRLQEEAREKRAADQSARDAAAAEQKKLRDARAAAAAEAERQAQTARDKEREEQAKAEQAAQATRAAAAPAEAGAQRAASTLQSSLKRKRYVAPEYPMDALSRQVGGVVVLEFTVDTQGEPRDIHVQSSEPEGVFDRAAISAVKRWRYEPLIVDGTATAVPVRMQIRFAPPDSHQQK